MDSPSSTAHSSHELGEHDALHTNGWSAPASLPSIRAYAPHVLPEPPERVQRQFFERIQSAVQFLGMLQAMPGVFHFVRDLTGRYVSVSPGLLRRLGFTREDEIVGRSSTEIFPPQIAEKFATGDAEIALTGHPQAETIELWPAARGGFDWWVAHKFPLRDSDGEIIGVIGTLQPLEEVHRARIAGTAVGKAVEFIQRHHHGDISVGEVARVVGLPPRHLSREFLEIFGTSTQDFITHTRMQAACEALAASDRSVGEISEACGFGNASSLATVFKRRTGENALAYRRRVRARRQRGPIADGSRSGR